MKVQVAQAFPGGWEELKGTVKDPERWKEMTGGLVDALRSLGGGPQQSHQPGGQRGHRGGGLPGMGMGGVGGAPRHRG